jgi:hypothetical protein
MPGMAISTPSQSALNKRLTPKIGGEGGSPIASDSREPWAVAFVDFNGDGKPDLAVTNTSGNPVTILLLGNGVGVGS